MWLIIKDTYLFTDTFLGHMLSKIPFEQHIIVNFIETSPA